MPSNPIHIHVSAWLQRKGESRRIYHDIYPPNSDRIVAWKQDNGGWKIREIHCIWWLCSSWENLWWLGQPLWWFIYWFLLSYAQRDSSESGPLGKEGRTAIYPATALCAGAGTWGIADNLTAGTVDVNGEFSNVQILEFRETSVGLGNQYISIYNKPLVPMMSSVHREAKDERRI